MSENNLPKYCKGCDMKHTDEEGKEWCLDTKGIIDCDGSNDRQQTI